MLQLMLIGIGVVIVAGGVTLRYLLKLNRRKIESTSNVVEDGK